MNNMLAGMMGNLYLISHDQSLSPDTRGRVARVNALCERAAAMIAQLLTFARKGMICMQPIDFRAFLDEALRLAELAVPEDIRVVHDFDEQESFPVIGDQAQLQQMVLNLLVNARDAVHGVPDPCIYIALRRVESEAGLHELYQGLAEGPWLELCIGDNGCGISESIRDKLFEPFFTTKEIGEGSGLGLSTVYGVVQSHQGAIQVDSCEREGSTFRILLPLHGEQPAVENGCAGILPRGNGETVLLVDDEEIVLSTTSSLLTHLGYRVIIAHTGVEALATTGADAADIALLDVVMPEMGGVETARRLRERNPRLPVVFATAYDRHMVLAREEQLPRCRVLSKPFRLQLLAEALRELLAGAQ